MVKEDENVLNFLSFLYPEKEFFHRLFLEQMKFSRH